MQKAITFQGHATSVLLLLQKLFTINPNHFEFADSSLDAIKFDFMRLIQRLQAPFFSGERPRSRRYERTAALRLLVQPCDEDDDDDYYFYPFPSNGAPVE
jgi:hypothetical protein